MEDIMDTRAVAKALGISPSAVNRLAARGTLPYSWKAGSRLFKKSEIEAYKRNEVAQRRRPPQLRLTLGDQDFDLHQALDNVRRQAIAKGKKS